MLCPLLYRKAQPILSSYDNIINMIRIKTNPKYSHLEPYLRQLTLEGAFNEGGEILYDKRNIVKLFEVNGTRIVVKRFGAPSYFNLLIYSASIRKSKAERAFRNAIRLRQLDINTPEEIAFVEIRKRGILQDNGSGGYDFQIIDTNRMKFGVFLTQQQRLINLQRLSCSAAAYIYILEQYARLAHIDPEYLQLKGSFTRLTYEFHRYYRHKLKNRLRKMLHRNQ